MDPGRLVDACGRQPGNACRFTMERTDSIGLAKLVDWLTAAPLQILLVVVGAVLLNRLVRRFIRRFAARIEGSAESA